MMKRVKVFQERQSFFVHLYESNEHFAGLCNMVLLQIVLFLVVALLRCLFFSEGFADDMSVFGGVSDWLRWSALELVQLSVALLIHPAFMVWCHLRRWGVLVDVTFALLYGALCIVTMGIVWQSVQALKLAPIPSAVSTLEHMRLVMKSYSFIRENAVKVMHPWNKDDEEGPPLWYKGQMEPSVGSLNKYFYFLFAPTFLYRDRYPRLRRGVCWRTVGAYLCQFLTLAYASKLFITALLPSSFELEKLYSCFLANLLLAEVTTLLASLMVLHAWQNLTAELTLFADREFYTDWWNSESYTVFYRKWNVPVYDWLNAYVYQDLRLVVKSRWATAVITFFLSSLLHDYHIAAAMGYFLPVFLVLFTGCGGMMFVVNPVKTSQLAKVLTLAGLFVGVALIVFVHLTELAARTHCIHTTYYYVTVHCLNLSTL